MIIPDVPFLHDDEIEADALEVLSDYLGPLQSHLLLVPVDKLLEHGLHLHLGYTNVPERCGNPSALAVIEIEDREVLIDDTLDPVESPQYEVVQRFCCGHEAGHWRTLGPDGLIHRLPADRREGFSTEDLLGQLQRCSQDRSRAAGYPRSEYIADQYAANLLMPAPLVRSEWLRQYDNLDPEESIRSELNRRFAPPPNNTGDRFEETLKGMARDAIIRWFSEVFLVSKVAMQKRLTKLGLLLPQ